MKTDDKGKPVSVRSKSNFRDHDGQVRDVTTYAKTATAAERALLQKLQDRARTGHSADLTAMDKLDRLLDLWEAKFKEQIADGTRSPTSLETYQRAIKNHVRPALGQLRSGEANTPRVDTVISQIKKNAGPPTAKTCRAVISGMMQLAVRYGAISINPVREVESIEHPAKKPARAIPTDEVTHLRTHLRADATAVRADLPDLVTFMLGTGARIGEALAVLWSQIDLDAATADITHTIVRIKGEGLIRKRVKSATSIRQVGLPTWLIAMLTALDEAGRSPRDAANQLGHSRVSMTQDNYFDRKAPTPAATQAIPDVMIARHAFEVESLSPVGARRAEDREAVEIWNRSPRGRRIAAFSAARGR